MTGLADKWWDYICIGNKGGLNMEPNGWEITKIQMRNDEDLS